MHDDDTKFILNRKDLKSIIKIMRERDLKLSNRVNEVMSHHHKYINQLMKYHSEERIISVIDRAIHFSSDSFLQELLKEEDNNE